MPALPAGPWRALPVCWCGSHRRVPASLRRSSPPVGAELPMDADGLLMQALRRRNVGREQAGRGERAEAVRQRLGGAERLNQPIGFLDQLLAVGTVLRRELGHAGAQQQLTLVEAVAEVPIE